MRFFSCGKIVTCMLVLLLVPVISYSQGGNPEMGEKAFKKNICSFCHGNEAQGKKGPEIAGLSISYSEFLKKLRTPNSEIMPPFSEQEITNKDAADIYAWLRSL